MAFIQFSLLSLSCSFINGLFNLQINHLEEINREILVNVLISLIAKKREETGFKTPPKSHLSPRLPNERTPPSAINDTRKVKKTKNCTKSSESHSDSANTSASMNNMRQVCGSQLCLFCQMIVIIFYYISVIRFIFLCALVLQIFHGKYMASPIIY